MFGALQPASGEAITATDDRRTLANGIDFLSKVEGWIDGTIERLDAVVDHLNIHCALDVLRFTLAHPCWDFVFQPKDAADLNIIEPWWKGLHSLALKGRRFEAWAEIEPAVEQATADWNDHKHLFVWGCRHRHRPPRRFGVAGLPKSSLI